MHNNAQTLHALNVVAVHLDPDCKIKLGLHPFSIENLANLRQKHNDSHFFKKFRLSAQAADTIVSLPLNNINDLIGDTHIERRIGDSLGIIKPLILSVLLQYFYDRKRTILAHSPLRVLGSKKGALIPESAGLPSWLLKQTVMKFDTRFIHLDDISQIILSCDVSTKTSITLPCNELIRIGFPLEGKYVSIEEPCDDPRLQIRRKLVGRVAKIQTETLALTDQLEGYETVATEKAFIEGNRENLEILIQLLNPASSAEIISTIEHSSAKALQGPDRFKLISNTFEHLRKADLELIPGISLKLGPLIAQDGKSRFPVTDFISKPHLVFDPSGSRVETWNQGGLDKHGPYDQHGYTPKRLRIAVVCQEKHLGLVDQFMHKFVEGLPNINTGTSQNANAPYQKGFYRRYMLEKPEICFFRAVTASASDYGKACREAITAQTDGGYHFDLAVVQIDDVFHQLPASINPYYVTKAIFLKCQVPVQEITLERMITPDNRLVYILNNISLACYAKIGGIPWLLKCAPTIAHELVIGLGSHHYSTTRLGNSERVVGITTVFTNDGNYLLDNRTTAVPYESYADALLSTLKRTIETIKKEQNWRDNDPVRLIFHCFKPLKNSEIMAVEKLIRSLGQTQTTFGFLTFSEEHPFLLFNTGNTGSKYASQLKGVLAPTRGVSIKLNRSESLITLTGFKELKTDLHGLPKPILMKLHPKSTFVDMTYLSRQAYNFSCHSWRTFSPAHLPITVLYSDLIAQKIKNLQQVSDWDPDAMLNQIGRTRWFL